MKRATSIRYCASRQNVLNIHHHKHHYPTRHQHHLFHTSTPTRNKQQQQPHERHERHEQTSAETNANNKKYVLSMFPYPSGSLHMGHVRVYTISDVISRAFRMNGHHVLHPMGWDAFGLPAENAAIERGVAPSDWTQLNIRQLKRQLELLDLNIDWENHEISTCSPDYYRWTQWLFLQLFKTGNAYQKESFVNWDPVDQTVLANEQVDAMGRSWRSGALVEKKKLRQWFFAIRKFAPQLLHDLDGLNDWPENVKAMQRAWIGESKGSEFVFKIFDKKGGGDGNGDESVSIKVFTTRPDTIFGVTYLAMAPEHDLVSRLTLDSEKETVTAFVQRLQSMSGTRRTEQAGTSKEGHFLGVYAIHPLTNQKIPVYIADYVISDFAEGCVMGVPAHDTRDYEFAKKHSIKVVQVIKPEENGDDAQQEERENNNEGCYTGSGTLINSGQFDGLSNNEAKQLITDHAEKLGVGAGTLQYRLRDWLVSRQRYWGAPIPIIHCPSCGPVAVPEDQLPVPLPEGIDFKSLKGNPLATAQDWLNVKCPCGKGVDCKRETDTMDTFVDSSWYFLRFTDARNQEKAFDPEVTRKWMNVDYYIGGIEHAVLHLLYSRYIHKFLRSLGYVHDKEPFKKLLTQGMVQGETFKNPETDRYYKPNEIERLADGSVVDKETRTVLKPVWEKMSKSKYNGVDPNDIVSKLGSDVIRLFILFKAPIEKELEWDARQIAGQERFLKKTESLIAAFVNAKSKHQEYQPTRDASFLVELGSLIDQTRRNIFDEQVLNTCISNLHKYSNVLHDVAKHEQELLSEAFETAIIQLSILMAPFAPTFATKMFTSVTQHLPRESEWRREPSVHRHPFPTSQVFSDLVESHVSAQKTVKVTLAFNGKARGEIEIAKDDLTNEDKLKSIITESKEGQKYLQNAKIQKIVVVAARNLVNIVCK